MAWDIRRIFRKAHVSRLENLLSKVVFDSHIGLKHLGASSLNIKTVGFAFIVVSVTSGCAGTVDTDGQKTVQGAETLQRTDNDSYYPDEVTCKRISIVGTRFKSKVCAPNSYWKSSEEAAKDTVEKLQRTPQRGDVQG